MPHHSTGYEYPASVPWFRVGVTRTVTPADLGVLDFSTSLADKLAIDAKSGLDEVAQRLIDVIRPRGKTLVVARDFLIEQGFTPPVVTDDRWLDVAAAARTPSARPLRTRVAGLHRGGRHHQTFVTVITMTERILGGAVTRHLAGDVLPAVRRSAVDEFTEFVTATGARLERFAFLLTGDHHLAEDLTQATFAKMYASWGRVCEDASGYARKTLLNSYISHRRLRRNSERPVDWTEDRAGVEVDPALRLDVLDALASLPALDRAVLVLRYWEDRSVADTAVDLGVSEDVVRSRSRRALHKLRPLLDPSERTLS